MVGVVTKTRLLLLAILLLTFLLHLLVVAEPFGRDQGIFAYIGNALLHGGVPYRDAWDHKTPGIYTVYALAFAAFGQAMSSVHLLEGLLLTFTSLVVFLIGRRLHSEGVGLLGALFYGLSATLLFEWWDRGQAEIYMALTGALAVYFLVKAFEDRPSPQARQPATPNPSGSPRGEEGAGGALAPGQAGGVEEAAFHASHLFIALSGAFCGLTIYFKPSGALLLAGMALAIVLLLWAGGRGRVLRALAALGLGFALSFVPLLVYFAANGALNDLYQTVIVFNTYHARIGGNPTLAGILTGTLDFSVSMNILTPLALVGLWLVLRPDEELAALPAGMEQNERQRRQRLALVIPIWLVASAAGIWTQGKFFSYHWSPVLPPLALLAAWGAAGIARELRRLQDERNRALVLLVCAAVLAVYVAALGRDHAPKWVRDASYLLGQTSRQQFLANFGHDIQQRDRYSFSETQQAADYLRAHSAPDDYVYVWGFQSLVNYLADRRSPTRYVFNYPLTFDRPEVDFRVQARRTFLQDLQQRPPAYIVLVSNDVNPLQAVDSLALLPGFPEFQSLISQQYRHETDIGDFHIYRRIDA